MITLLIFVGIITSFQNVNLNSNEIHVLNRLTSDINWALNDKQCLGACLIDLEKAFDTI